MSEPYLDEAQLEELRSILEDEFPALIAAYIQDSAIRVEELQQAFARGDANSLCKSAHSFKGASANLALTYLTTLCRDLEDNARAGVLAGQEALLREIGQEQQRAVELLKTKI